MQISSINNTYYQNYNIKNRYNKNNITSLNSDTRVISPNNVSFKGKINKDFFIKTLNLDPIYTFKNFTVEEYLKLSQVQKSKLRKDFIELAAQDPVNLTGIGEIHAYAADCMMKTFDKRFGKGNYIVIPIGRSLSSIGKSLGIKIGENNVVNIPMSSASRFMTSPVSLSGYQDFVNNLKKNKGLKTLKKYLASHNLTKNDIETSGKNYILTDYCYSGYSLKGAEQLFKSDEIWGNKNDNIYAVDFLKLLNKYNENTIDPPIKLIPETQNIFNKIQSELFLSAYKDYATVGKTFSLGDTITAAKYKQNVFALPKKTKLVWFNLIDTIMAGKGDFQVKLKHDLIEESFYPKIKKQNVEPWHTSESQFDSDLRNTLNEINKILVKYSSLMQSNHIHLNESLINDIKGVHTYLSNCYRKQSFQNKFNFYEIQSDIKELINKINSKIEY